MIRGPHQSDSYIDQETSHADHEDAIEPGPHSIPHDEENAAHRAIRRASRRHWAETIAERRAG